MTTPSSVSEALTQANEHLKGGAEALPIAFEFDYGHAHFQGKVSELGDNLVLAITGNVGELPYTIINPTARQMLFDFADVSKDFKNVDFQIANGSVIRMRHLSVITPPLDAATLIGATVQHLFAQRHYFKFINMLRHIETEGQEPMGQYQGESAEDSTGDNSIGEGPETNRPEAPPPPENG